MHARFNSFDATPSKSAYDLFIPPSYIRMCDSIWSEKSNFLKSCFVKMILKKFQLRERLTVASLNAEGFLYRNGEIRHLKTNHLLLIRVEFRNTTFSI